MACAAHARLITRDELEWCGARVKARARVPAVTHRFYSKPCYAENVLTDLFGLIRLAKCVLVLFKLGMLGLVTSCNRNRPGYSATNSNRVTRRKLTNPNSIENSEVVASRDHK